jgi:hypothetical protein
MSVVEPPPVILAPTRAYDSDMARSEREIVEHASTPSPSRPLPAVRSSTRPYGRPWRYARHVRPDELEERLQQRLDALPRAARAELLHVLMLPDFERGDRIGEFWG